jgi:hypothetical protein
LAAALARFDQLSRSATRLENEASRAGERLYAYFSSRDWDTMAEIVAVDTVVDDRRRMVNFGQWHGRDVVIANHRAIGRAGANITSTVIATRGRRLALLRGRNHDLQGQEFDVDFLTIVETDTDSHIATHIAFDLDDVDAAFEEIESRYLAGEAAAHADTWSVVAGVHAMFNRHELPPTDWVTIDHRRGTPFASSEMTSAIHTLFDLTPDFSVHIETVHRLNDFGAVITNIAHGSSPDGLDVEWRMVMVQIVDGDRLTRCECFDEAALDAAIAKFDELCRPVPRLENKASRAIKKFLAHFAAHEWDAMANQIAEDFCSDDRRRGINAGIRRGREVEMANWRATAEVWMSDVRAVVVATRGERLALFRFTFASQDSLPAAFQAAAVSVVQVNDENRCAAAVIFDPDDLETALAELETRYLAGEAAAYRRTWSTLMRNFAAFNERKLPSTTPDWVNLDNRRGRAFSPGDLIPYIHATWQVMPQAKIYVCAVHRLSDVGAVVTQSTHGTSPDGFDAEWLEVTLVTLDGDLINRIEVFDEADLDAALARFEELQPRAPRLENAATRVYEKLLAYYAARDWSAVSEIVSADLYSDDRRPVVGGGTRNGRTALLEDLRAVAAVGFASATSDAIATRGARVALTRACYSRNHDEQDESYVDYLQLVEIDTDTRIIALVAFDPDDVAAAFKELETRYLAGDAAAQTRTWSAVVEGYAALNRGQLPETTTDFVDVDHRRGAAMAPGELIKFLRSAMDQTPDLTIRIAAVHRLGERGAVVTHAATGTSPQGFEAEWREVSILTIDGDRLNRIEVFDEADLDAAFARFDELTGEDQPK